MNTIGRGWEADQLTAVVVEHRSRRCRRRGRQHVRQRASAPVGRVETSARLLSTPLAYLWRAGSSGSLEWEGQ